MQPIPALLLLFAQTHNIPVPFTDTSYRIESIPYGKDYGLRVTTKVDGKPVDYDYFQTTGFLRQEIAREKHAKMKQK